MTRASYVPSAEVFWSQAVRIYEEPGMQARLLAAQDNHGHNVNLALLAIYLARQQAPLTEQEHASLASVVRDFNLCHTAPLRQLRRQLSGSDALSPQCRQQLKKQLLAAELTLEQQEQALLLEQLKQLRG